MASVSQRFSLFNGFSDVRNGIRKSLGGRTASTSPGIRCTVVATRCEVWAVVERLERCDGPARASRRGRKQLARVERMLAAHFAGEEGAGHLEDSLQVAPRYHNQARRLSRQHGELLAEIRAIRLQAQAAATSPEGWADVYRAYDAFAERLKQHVEAENEIQSRAVLDDLGPGD